MIKSMRKEPGERGQALVVMVFAVIALLVIAGLAIDGGMVFLDRRRMQNAADAAALAGTRLLAGAICGEGSDDAAIAAEVNHYAEKNGVPDNDTEAGGSVTGNVVADYVDFDEAVLGRVGGGAIPNGATGVSVTVGIGRPTYFVSLVGIDTAGASAAALAMTGRPLMGGGMRPFGIPYPVVGDLSDGDCFDISFGNCDQDEADDFPRAISSNPGGQLQDWMQNGWNGTLYADGFWNDGYHNGDYIHAKPGTEQDVINVAPIGELIHVPIYDAFPDCDGVAPDIATPYPQSPNACTGMQGADYYHIVGFAGVRIQSTSTPDHSMYMCLEETIMGEGQPGPSGGYGSDVCAMHTMVVTLWK
jgi:Flp pilus assembly protein TadG